MKVKGYEDCGKHDKVVSNIHFVHEIERHNPLSLKYAKYWKEMKKRCIEGYWYEGKYMPGSLYFYANFGRILMHVNGSKTKSVGRPFLRDVEWEKAYVYLEAKGFSGFEDDDVTCSKWVKEVQDLPIDEAYEKLDNLIFRKKITKTEVLNPESFPNNPKLKPYENPRTYMRKLHATNLGAPLFRNNAKNVADLETRRIGKSYFAGNGMINHNFLFDGANNYTEYLAAIKNGEPFSSETLVGAIDAKYTKDLLSKCQLGLDNLPGATTLNGELHPSPLSKLYRGSFAIGKYVEAAHEVKMAGGWKTVGSRSKIHNRSFADNPLAGNGTGPNLTVIEEFGFMNNLKDTLGALKDASYEGSDKFGVIWMTGTGGQGDAAAISHAKDVFYDPHQFDCLAFEDIWEESGDIGYFVPYQMRLDEYRDSEGNIDQPKALYDIEIKRDVLKKGKSKAAYYSELQNNPLTPSEAFMIDDSNIFPVAELKEHLNWLKSNQHDGFVKGMCGELAWASGEKGLELKWKPDIKNNLEPCGYPVRKEDGLEGCIQIWEHPQQVGGSIPFGMYIAGTDPYDQDQAESSASLGSTFIYKTFHTDEGIYNWPVAEYSARPGTAKEHHETVRKLLVYYNAKCLYENERNTIKMHFEHKNSLYLLCKTPDILKATERSKVQRQYGTHMTKQIKVELELYLRDWLTEVRGTDGDGLERLNLHMIYSMPLVEELIRYNDTGNFDRVISFMLTNLHRLQNHNIKVKEVKEVVAQDSFFTRAGKFF